MRVIRLPVLPSAFTRLDDSLFTLDEFTCVRDQHVLRKNHNALLAQRVRMNPIAQFIISGSGDNYTVTPLSSRVRPPVILSGTMLLNYGCKSLRFELYAARTIATPAADPKLGVSIWPIGGDDNWFYVESMASIAITSTTAGWYTLDVPVKYYSPSVGSQAGYKVPLGFSVYLESQIDVDSGAYIAGAAVVNATAYNVQFTSASTVGYGYSIEIDGSNVPPSQCLSISTTIGGDQVAHVDPPFSSLPSSADTVTVRQICGVHLLGLSAYEMPITDFDAAAGAI